MDKNAQRIDRLNRKLRSLKVPATFAAFQEWCRPWALAAASGRSKRANDRLAERQELAQQLYARTVEGEPPAANPELGPCWLWTGARMKRGYGTVSIAGRTQYVHRVFYEQIIGKIGEGLETDHKCRVLHCINPRHLEAVTGAENKRRAAEARTHCRRGHAFTEENLTGFEKRLGRRQCRTCTNERQVKLRAKREAEQKASKKGAANVATVGLGDLKKGSLAA